MKTDIKNILNEFYKERKSIESNFDYTYNGTALSQIKKLTEETVNKIVNQVTIPDEIIKQAAKEDYQNQTKYDNAYDRQKGFIAGVKWLMKLIYR